MMKKILYLTNIEVPYRVRFFNELAKHCDLTVLYERDRSANRNDEWARSEKRNHRVRFLRGIRVGGENAFSLGILKEIFSGYDSVIVGCYNSPVQMLAILAMRLLRIPYLVNLDGETFLEGKGPKAVLKRFFLSGAEKYLVAGQRAAQSLRSVFPGRQVIPYYFSSLSGQEVADHRIAPKDRRDGAILVVGQYFDYKGMDIALDAARRDDSLHYKFVGMGSRTALFEAEHPVPANVELIPFLQKPELEREYRACSMLVLPSRQECWGLVINEAASFGTPIVSTWGSGAAVEFLAERYPEYLANPGDGEDLYRCIRRLAGDDRRAYSDYLAEKSGCYTIEKCVQAHLAACGLCEQER